MRNLIIDGAIRLYGICTSSDFPVPDFDDASGYSGSDVVAALAENGAGDVTIKINSAGGDALEGLAIHSILSLHPGQVTIEVEGVAASAASLIAMAGDEIIMRAGSLMMIHDPSGVTFGTRKDHEKTQGTLSKLANQMAELYVARSGKPIGEVLQKMEDETWFTAEEAVEEGFADTADATRARVAPAFDYSAYSQAPQRLVALATRKQWKAKSMKTPKKAPAKPDQKVEPDTDENETEMGARFDELAEALEAAIVRIDELEARLEEIDGSEEEQAAQAYSRNRMSASQGQARTGLGRPSRSSKPQQQKLTSWSQFGQ